MSRIRYQRAEESKMALEAMGDHNLERSWFEGVALLESQADAMAYKFNSARADRRAMKRVGAPGGMFG